MRHDCREKTKLGLIEMQIVTYRADKHTFFDEFATLLVSLSSFNAAVESFWNCGLTKIPTTPDHTLYLYGRLLAIAWRPNEFMHDVKQDRWPTQLNIAHLNPIEPAAQPAERGVPFSSSAAWRMVHGLVGSMFVRYFEKFREQIEAKYGSDTTRWPDCWNFGRVVRNALAHDGLIEMRNAQSAPVAWRGVTIGPCNNGKVLFSRSEFLDVADLVALVEDLDRYVA